MDESLWIGKEGDYLEYTFDEPVDVKSLCLIFDSDLNRKGYNMPCRYLLDTPYLKLPETLIRSFAIELTDEKGCVTTEIYENHKRFVKIPVGKKVKRVRLIPLSTWGAEDYRVFSFEVI